MSACLSKSSAEAFKAMMETEAAQALSTSSPGSTPPGAARPLARHDLTLRTCMLLLSHTQVQAMAGTPSLHALLVGQRQHPKSQAPLQQPFTLPGSPSAPIEEMLAWIKDQGGMVCVLVGTWQSVRQRSSDPPDSCRTEAVAHRCLLLNLVLDICKHVVSTPADRLLLLLPPHPLFCADAP